MKEFICSLPGGASFSLIPREVIDGVATAMYVGIPLLFSDHIQVCVLVQAVCMT